jgi:hypothetical protein
MHMSRRRCCPQEEGCTGCLTFPPELQIVVAGIQTGIYCQTCYAANGMYIVPLTQRSIACMNGNGCYAEYKATFDNVDFCGGPVTITAWIAHDGNFVGGHGSPCMTSPGSREFHVKIEGPSCSLLLSLVESNSDPFDCEHLSNFQLHGPAGILGGCNCITTYLSVSIYPWT